MRLQALLGLDAASLIHIPNETLSECWSRWVEQLDATDATGNWASDQLLLAFLGQRKSLSDLGSGPRPNSDMMILVHAPLGLSDQ